MRYLYILILIFILSPFSSFAQKNVITKIMGGDAIAFVEESKLTASAKDQDIKSLKYDITMVSTTDSVSITSTIITEKVLHPDSVSLSGIVTKDIERLYAEPKGNKWTTRLRFYVPLNEIEKITSSDESPQLTWYVENKTYTFTLSEKEWKKQKRSWEYAIEIVKENR